MGYVVNKYLDLISSITKTIGEYSLKEGKESVGDLLKNIDNLLVDVIK